MTDITPESEALAIPLGPVERFGRWRETGDMSPAGLQDTFQSSSCPGWAGPG